MKIQVFMFNFQNVGLLGGVCVFVLLSFKKKFGLFWYVVNVEINYLN